jgi:NAD(P)-dependent dehydrogenase (short-subunit alcohol dehydrogenase family)
MTTKLFDLSGRTALITGGGTGLGRQFARVLSGACASVVLCARRVDKLEETAAEIRDNGGNALCVPMDITDAGQIAAGFDAAKSLGPVSILVNNAGTVAEPSLLELDESEWDSVIDTNLKGAWLVAREATRRMISAEMTGTVINIASILGSAVQKGTGPYAVSKAALIHMTRVMALEWARYGVRVNAIAPGYFATDLAADFLDTDFARNMIKRVPQRRLGNLEDLSGPILLLASDASDYMTGTTITVDGGHSMAVI